MNVYTSYEKLWMMLAERDIGKKDICSATGISTRTMAKLSKNESVTTDTLSKICDVLGCDIGDIVTFSRDPIFVSPYDAFKKTGALVSETEYYKVFEFTFENHSFRVYKTKKIADKRTIIKCENSDIIWRQISKVPRLDGTGFMLGTNDMMVRVSPDKNAVILFVISGKPGEIRGLDDGFFRSARRYGGEGYVHVMSESAFKCLSVPK